MALGRWVTTVGSYTLASRLLGFVRDILIAAILGTGPISDAFFVAFKFPNLFRRLFAEGAVSAAFVPMFAGKLDKVFGAAIASIAGASEGPKLKISAALEAALAEGSTKGLVEIKAAPKALEPEDKSAKRNCTSLALTSFPLIL